MGVIMSQVPYATYPLRMRLDEPSIEEFVDFWEATILQLHNELRPGSCRRMMTEVSEMIQTLHGFFQALTPDDVHEV